LSEISEGRAMLATPAGAEVLVLNATGTIVWEALADEGDPVAIARRIHDEHPAMAVDAIEADVRGFLAELLAESLVEAQ
jgi:Coenzyme PQQ synthesis protein D (PqqD)